MATSSYSSRTGLNQGVLVASIISATVILLIKAVFNKRLTNKDGNSIPNGPIGLPIVGSFPFLTDYPELTLDHWAKKFGSLYSLWLGDQLFMVISDPNIVKDLMVTNGAIFSSRKEMFLKSRRSSPAEVSRQLLITTAGESTAESQLVF
jgi:hypothetical protein